ncbi:3'-5' exonuclease [Bellilinea sp.]|jgi:DNA polymerase-3 subunit epsilon|uniref:3'-5' exonuclease n=1 Tax=Bellilinea caldifistulae TaxID=360411 RepID=A0A7C4L178_9CHLR
MELTIDPRRQAIIQQARQWIRENPVFMDTETTGLDKNAEIVEIAVIDCDGSILFESFVRPSRPIPPDLTAIHGIDNQMVKKAPTFPVVWASLRTYLLDRKIALYNAEFDLRMMRQSYEIYKLAWKERLTTLDIMQLYAAYRGEWDATRRAYRYFKLEEAGKSLRIPLPNSHRAADDARLTRALLYAIAGMDYSFGKPE